MRFATIIGTRPEFVQLWPVSREIGRRNHEEVFVFTGQHYDDEMVFLDELGLPEPAHCLGVGSASHGEQTGKMLEAIEKVLLAEKPDAVIVFGDTNTTLAGALAASKLNIKVAHVEAGLRSLNREMPEEVNRVVADHVSDCLFAPTPTAMTNLKKEGLCGYLVGDVMVDSLVKFAGVARSSEVLERFGLLSRNYMVLTLHRPSNVDSRERLDAILNAVEFVGIPALFPKHPRAQVYWPSSVIEIVEPLGHLDFLQALMNASIVVTDSGGVQKQAYMLGVPCVTVRDETEWAETVEAGWNMLASPETLVEAVTNFRIPASRPNVFGEVGAASRIMDILEAS